MTDRAKIEKVLAGYKMTQRGEAVVVEQLISIAPFEVEVRSIVGVRAVPGWAVWSENPDDDTPYLTAVGIDPVLVKAAEVLAAWKAKEVLQRIDDAEYAAELERQAALDYFS